MWKAASVPSQDFYITKLPREHRRGSSASESLDLLQRKVITAGLNGRHVFITGFAGTGKKFTLFELIKSFRKDGRRAAVTASTGSAGVAIGGSTVHSFLHLGLGDLSLLQARTRTISNVSLQKKLQAVDTLVVDEISMIDGHLFDLVEAVCSAARQKRFYFSKVPENEVSRSAFGGLQIVVCGDFFQLAPVQSRFNSNISFAFESKAWRKTIEIFFCSTHSSSPGLSSFLWYFI
ncbi:ATP-dependent DNA helicase PIF1 [Gracilariopsis chorda]|uniref:ATP-dependent DNA helicase n=1 Tax=Gracilariopsis chorda TaxID=448386 RepID=A0A2V3IQD2_9FLOR|nr:ATP-dependent DNA helicase PIF1 [Gracilariopsis chorda]|eukprot:PXF44311.1 ATP-dependent DNA helicase PIF1 [Gracilariopsis chorda]